MNDVVDSDGYVFEIGISAIADSNGGRVLTGVIISRCPVKGTGTVKVVGEDGFGRKISAGHLESHWVALGIVSRDAKGQLHAFIGALRADSGQGRRSGASIGRIPDREAMRTIPGREPRLRNRIIC